MDAENLVGLRYHGRFYTGFISQCQKHLMSKVSVGMFIPIIVRVITIWNKVLFKLRVYFYGLVISKKVFLESSHRIYTHLDVVLRLLYFQSTVESEFCLDKEFIEFLS